MGGVEYAVPRSWNVLRGSPCSLERQKYLWQMNLRVQFHVKGSCCGDDIFQLLLSHLKELFVLATLNTCCPLMGSFCGSSPTPSSFGVLCSGSLALEWALECRD